MDKFNEQLMKALCESDDNEDKVCLISNEILKDDHVELECGHKFNYESMFKELIQQKKDGLILK